MVSLPAIMTVAVPTPEYNPRVDQATILEGHITVTIHSSQMPPRKWKVKFSEYAVLHKGQMQPVWRGPRSGLCLNENGVQIYINSLSKGKIELTNPRPMIRATLQVTITPTNIRLSLSDQADLILNVNPHTIPLHQFLLKANRAGSRAVVFSGHVVCDTREPVWIGRRGGLFVINSEGRQQYINELERGAAVPTLSTNNRYRLMLAVVA